MPGESLLTRQPLPGYTLIERIGSGGYGEVWRAEAPGGLVKAVKFVFGTFNESRANRERKSVDRIKDVRHPFLLSIERIEVVDSQFILVTELADCSLKDRFSECQSLGMPGIPRDELLSHMRDAADALDFMLERHSLQHLDIKPENLLLLGNRIKVADFGLVKDLHDASVSMLDGLTPLYAPPELFNGRPTNRSDQYSLAVVYMEMLTGRLPFNASTAAQLAAMHILPGYQPNVSAVPEADREPVLRALSREPKARFGSCREFVQQLCGQHRSSAAAPALAPTSEQWPRGTISPTEVIPEGGAPNSVDNLASQTDVLGLAGDAESAESTTNSGISATRVRTQGEVATLTPIEWDPLAWKPRPTLIVGIGGTAGRVIRSLRQRLALGHGGLAVMPAFSTLLLDTDSDALHVATAASLAGASSSSDTVLLRLRTTSEYREQSSRLLQWISRRWLYNIPRRPQTQGLRPLGRLALIDHGKVWLARLKESLEAITSPCALAQSQRALDREWDTAPRVVVVASLSGGAGSGAVVDVAFSVRQTLQSLGIGRYELCGILTHSTGGGLETQELSVASARAAMQEICHFATSPGGYPGDKSMGLAAAAPRTPLFDSTYYLHLGNQLSEFELERATDRIGEYLYHELTTPLGQLLAQIRKASPDRADVNDDVTLRTCALHRLSGQSVDVMELTARSIAEQMIKVWLAPPGSSTAKDAGAHHDRDANLSNMSSHATIDQIRALVNEAFGERANATFRQRLTKWLAAQCDAAAETAPENKPASARNELAALERGLADLVVRFRDMSDVTSILDDEQLGPEADDADQQAIQRRMPEIVAQATIAFWTMAESLAVGCADVSVACHRLESLPELLLSAAYQAARRALDGDQVLNQFLLKLGDPRHAVQSLRSHFQLASPTALQTGGAKRLILVAPRAADHTTLLELIRRVLGENLTVVEGDTSDLLLICEGEQLSLRQCADQLVEGRQIYVDAANRLCTRIDIEWQKMPLLE